MEQFRFLYDDFGGEDVTVCQVRMLFYSVLYSCLIIKIMVTSQKWKGAFLSPLIIQTFAAHLKATTGAQEIPGLLDSGETTHAVIGGLCLAAASVSIIYYPREIVLTIFIVRWGGHCLSLRPAR
jgi:hypothetical protein